MIRLLAVTVLGAVLTLAVVSATTQVAAGQALPDTPTPTDTPPPTATDTPPLDTATVPAATPTATTAGVVLPPTGTGSDGDQTVPWLAVGAALVGAVALASAAFGLRAIKR